MDVCYPNEADLWGNMSFTRPDDNECLHDADSKQASSLKSRPAPSAVYNIFRRASTNHGSGSGYQSELKKLVGLGSASGERWTDSWFVWTLAIPVTLTVALLAQVVVKKIFGRLRMTERQHTRERLWNLAFYKFIFIFGVVNVESMEEIVLWLSWFILLGYMHFFIVLARDRCEYMSFSPSPSRGMHGRIVGLLACLMTVSSGMLVTSVWLCWNKFIHTGLFMAAEALLVLLPSWHILVRYGVRHLRQARATSPWNSETKGALYYNLNVAFDMSRLVVDVLHQIHQMCQVCNLSASSLVLVAQIRHLCAELFSKFRRHKNYLAVSRRLQAAYGVASKEDFEDQGDMCSICWDKMEQARKLHCGHIFHEYCLLLWLEQDVSCPVCRKALNSALQVPAGSRPAARLATGRQFHFPGARINRWLPNVSVTVSHPVHDYLDNSSIDHMAEQVQQVFPNVSHHLIIRDLLETGDPSVTIDNILNGNFDHNHPGAMPTADDLQFPAQSTSDPSDRPPPILTTLKIDGVIREIPDTPEACRALQIQRRETLLYEARKKLLAKMAQEKELERAQQASK